jgi:hypothetical protein
MAEKKDFDWTTLSSALAKLPAPEQEPTQAWGALFSALATNVHDRYYKGQTIHLDGYSFTNCCFHNCTLVTASGLFSFRSCTLMNSNIQLGTNAIRIVKLFNIFQLSPWSSFNPTVESDGSVTIP